MRVSVENNAVSDTLVEAEGAYRCRCGYRMYINIGKRRIGTLNLQVTAEDRPQRVSLEFHLWR